MLEKTIKSVNQGNGPESLEAASSVLPCVQALADSLDAAVRPQDSYYNTLIRILATRCMTQVSNGTDVLLVLGCSLKTQLNLCTVEKGSRSYSVPCSTPWTFSVRYQTIMQQHGSLRLLDAGCATLLHWRTSLGVEAA